MDPKMMSKVTLPGSRFCSQDLKPSLNPESIHFSHNCSTSLNIRKQMRKFQAKRKHRLSGLSRKYPSSRMLTH